MTEADLVKKLWGFCHLLRHDGISYGEYVEQLTYLLFLRMADEHGLGLPEKTDWRHIKKLSGSALTDEYAEALRALGKQEGLLGDIFSGAQSRFRSPVNLKTLIELIAETDWTTLDVDVKAAAFEGLLEQAASEGKKGAGQYFTPRILIQSIVRVMKPDPRENGDFTIGDPACGSGGFLVAAYEWLMKETGGALRRDTAMRVRTNTYHGQDLVPQPRRLALMNLYLHGVEPHIKLGDTIYEVLGPERFDVVLTNPPFGTQGAKQVPEREDFTTRTANKQLNFLQHVLSVLKRGGRAAVVVPDSVLFEDQAGEVFEILTDEARLHTIMRLPNGTFTPYSPIRTNVLFFTKGQPTKGVWIYDGRTNVQHITKVERPLTPDYFEEFERCFGDSPDGLSDRTERDSPDGGWLGGNRWRRYGIEDLRDRQFKVDTIKWLRDEFERDDDALPPPEELTTDIVSELQSLADEINSIKTLLEESNQGVR